MPVRLIAQTVKAFSPDQRLLAAYELLITTAAYDLLSTTRSLYTRNDDA